MKLYSIAPWMILCATSFGASNLRAQSTTERDMMTIDAAIAQYLRPSLPTHGVVFEPRVKTPNGWASVRSSDRIAALAAALGAAPVYHDSIYVCGRRPADCRLLRNTSVILSFGDPVISGNSAVVRMSRLRATDDPNGPVSRQDSEVHLARSGAGWRVVSLLVTSVT